MPVSGKAVAVAAMRLRCPLEQHSASEDFWASIVTILATAGNIRQQQQGNLCSIIPSYTVASPEYRKNDRFL